jgi:hypothetical protein
MRRTDPAIAAAVRGLARSWRLRFWVGVMLVFGAVSSLNPLYGVLGFEHAFAVGVVMSIAGLDLGSGFVRRVRAEEAQAQALARAMGAWRIVLAIAWRAAALAAAVALIPAVIAALRGLAVPVCDWGFGVRAELLLPVATGAIAAGAGVAIALVVERPWRCAAAMAALWLAVAICAAWRFFVEPPVFTYNGILGYFPGNIYDEDVTLGWTLVWSRLEQLAAVGAMLALAAAWIDAPTLRARRAATRRPSGFRIVEAIAAAVLAVGAGVLYWQSGPLGFAVDASDIDAELDGVKITPHFVIHYARRADIEADIDLIAADHEFRYAQVVRALGVEMDERIDSYYFADADQKARLMGARTVEMAKPWQRAIFLEHEGFPVPALRHEIAHVVAGEFGDPWLAVSARRVAHVIPIPNPGLIEGLAVAVDWPSRYDALTTPDQATRVMSIQGDEPSLDALLSLGFLSQSSARAYTTAGSFLHFLLDRYGAARFRDLYRSGGDFAAAYGRSRSELEKEWRQMIAAVVVPPDALEIGRETFRRGGVFEVPCPHAVAALRSRAVDLDSADDHGGAVALMREVCADDPSEPRYQLELADLLWQGDASEIAEARAIDRQLAADTDGVTAPLRAQALATLGEHAARDGDFVTAEDALAKAAALPAGAGRKRTLAAELLALRDRGPAAPAYRAYFFSTGDKLALATAMAAIEPERGLAFYLRGLQRAAREDHAGAADDLARSLALGVPGPLFVSNAARILAVEGWRAGDHAHVAQAADVLAGTGNEVEALLAKDWRERIEFAVTGSLPAAITSR